MGLFDVREPAVLDTRPRPTESLARRWILLKGAHPALTALLAVVEERARPGSAPDPIDVMARLASPTGSIPTALHPSRGALQQGDDLLSAAMFVLVALDRVRADRKSLTILSDLVSATELPTPFGRISCENGEVQGAWTGPAPTIIFAEKPERA